MQYLNKENTSTSVLVGYLALLDFYFLLFQELKILIKVI